MFDRDLLDSLVTDGWLRSQRHPEADLTLYNYTERTQYEKHWTPETRAARGLILDLDGNVIARGFPKFFNLGEPGNDVDLAGPCRVTKKLDGSLGIVYRIPGDDTWRVATRGSFTSEQARAGALMLADHELHVHDGTTALFEIIYPENRIVIDYGGRRDLCLLTTVENDTGHDSNRPAIYSGPRVTAISVGREVDLELLRSRNVEGEEGYVATFLTGRVKLKFDEYVRLHKIVTGINARSIWEALRAGQDPTAELDGVPDELYRWIAVTAAGLREHYADVERASQRVVELRSRSMDRKETAAYFQTMAGEDALLPAMFAILDGKPYADIIWRKLKPAAFDTPLALPIEP